MPDLPMHDDDLYSRDGETYNGQYYPKKSDEDEKEDSRQDAINSASFPIIKDVAKWFEAQIAAAGDIDNIETRSMSFNGIKYSRTVSIEAQVLAAQLLKEKLAMKFEEFKDFAGRPEDSDADDE